MAGMTQARSDAIEAVKALLGDRVTTNQGIREQHGRGEAWHASVPPDAVVYPQTTEEVRAVVGICAAHGMPAIPFGVGTSLEGHVAALQGGVSVDLSGMNRVLRVGAEDLDVTVQPGVTRKQLNEHLRDTGLFFPIDPGADATIGGMAATRCSGTNAVRYGTMRENVLGLEVVLADGRVIRTGGRARKSAAGYDLTRLFVGSEGTLGIITEVTLRLYGIPEAMSAARCSFETLEGAVRTVIETIQVGIPVARIEILDSLQIDACNRYSGLDEPIAPTLFFEFHGTAASVAEQAETVGELASGNGGSGFRWTTRPEDRNKLWQARHDAYYAALGLRPGAKGMATDVCVPISRLADCVMESTAEFAAHGILAPLVGHAGDGNFHLTVLIDPEDAAEVATVKRLVGRMIDRALEMGGTCTGEHGVGYGKMAYLQKEHGDALAVMRAVKRALDPENLLNPGKIVAMN